ncbi:hypothetical protein H4Q26_006540 [Puccinia striiformis f. sp. tritici PST-130]|nr:hypothetical protein H4Q26_006540 [Puccinia striiformis f. sp. tritici PST-130]
MAEDQSPKVSNSFRVSTINNISIKSETEDFSALINNPEDRTYLGRTLAKEYLGIKEEFYQAYHQFSPPPKHPTLNISGQNKQALEDSVTKIISVNIPYDTGSRKFLVNNQDISFCSSHFLVGLMRPSAKLGEEARVKTLNLKDFYHFYCFSLHFKTWDNMDHVIDDERGYRTDSGIGGVVSFGCQGISNTEDGCGEALDEAETDIGGERGMATIEDGGNCPRTFSIYIPNDSRQRTHPLRRGGTLRFISEDGWLLLEQRN